MFFEEKGAIHGSRRTSDTHASLRPAYVVFICTYDPFNAGLPVYTFTTRCVEDRSVELGDGAVTVMVNASAGSEGLYGPIAELVDYMNEGRIGGGIASRIDEAVDDDYAEEDFMARMFTLEYDLDCEKDYIRKESEARGEAKSEARMKSLISKMIKSGTDTADIAEAMEIDPESAVCQVRRLSLTGKHSLHQSVLPVARSSLSGTRC